MQRLNLLLDVWREVCRHLEIGESVGRLAPILARRLPVRFLLVRHFDLQRSCLETVATGCCASHPMTLRPRHGLSGPFPGKLAQVVPASRGDPRQR